MLVLAVLLTRQGQAATSFLLVPGAGSESLTEVQQNILSKITARKRYLSHHLLSINGELDLTKRPPTIDLKLPQGGVFHATSQWKTIHGAPGTPEMTVFSSAPAPGKSIVLIDNNGTLTGTIRMPGGLFNIVPVGPKQELLVQEDPTKLPPDEPASFREKQEVKAAAMGGVRFNAEVSASSTKRSTLRIMVVYTPAVLSAVTDINALINQAVAETQISYDNSNVFIDATLVGSYETQYVESGVFQTDLDRLATNGDGFMDEIHGERASVHADVVVLLVNDDQACGIADAIMANASSAFAVVDYSCATGYYSFAHEIGHLQGARHDVAEDANNAPFAYGHGYTDAVHQFRTIMGYDDSFTQTDRIPYWSNPAIIYNGAPTGVVGASENAKVLNQTAPTVGSFGDQLPPPPPP